MKKGYTQVKKIIQSEIFSGKYKPGSRLPTGAELCDAFNVSHMTVSRALQELVKEGLISRSRSHGTIVCEMSRTFKGEIFLFISTLSANSTFSDLASGLENVLNHNRYRLAIGQTNGDVAKTVNYAEMISNSPEVKGVIYAPIGNRNNWEQNDEVIKILKRHNIPIVIAGNLESEAINTYSSVSSNHYVTARQLVKHLICVCRRENIFLLGKIPNRDQEIIIKGFCDEMKTQKSEKPMNNVILLDSDHSMSAFLKRTMNSNLKPDAFFCLTDIIAMETVKTLEELNIKVPEDIAVTGFGDVPAGQYCSIPITTAKVKHKEEGELLAGLLIDIIEGMRKDKVNILVDCDLKIRKSCGHNLIIS